MTVARIKAVFHLFSIAVTICILALGPAAAATPAKPATVEYAKGRDLFFKGNHAAAITHLKKSAAQRPKIYPERKNEIIVCDPPGVCDNLPPEPPPSAEEHAAAASCLLGDFYALGLGTRKDIRAAAKWWYLPVDEHNRLLAASDKGDAAAWVALGDLYMSCPCRLHVKPDEHATLETGRELIKKMAHDLYAAAFDLTGDGHAALRLGKMTERSLALTPEERGAALPMFRIAAEQGIAEGQYEYGMQLRRNGWKIRGLSWLRKAEAQGYAPAIKYLNDGRTRELRSGGGYEGIVVLVFLAAAFSAVFRARKKKPLRDYMTWRNMGIVAVCIAIFALAIYAIGQTPVLSRAVDHLFFLLMQSRVYMPDALADNMYFFMLCFIIMLVAFVLLIICAVLLPLFGYLLLQGMNAGAGKRNPPG